jgi:hypothetical protein
MNSQTFRLIKRNIWGVKALRAAFGGSGVLSQLRAGAEGNLLQLFTGKTPAPIAPS